MLREIYKYRFWCNDEKQYKYVWNEKIPTECPTNASHSIDTSSYTIIDTIKESAAQVVNLPKTTFDELRVAERTLLIELKSIFGKSTLRDLYIEEGNATIENNLGDSEYTLTVSGSNDVAWLQSAERGRYVAGLQGDVGIASRLTSTLTGNQTCKIGLFDDQNGFYYKYSSNNDVCACILVDGTEIEMPRSTWNKDSFDGNGISKVNLNPLDGNIYNIRFTWYGYGNIEYRLNTANLDNEQSSYVGHIYKPYAQTSVRNPNLPLSVCLANNGTTATTSVKVAGRQYSVIGRYNPVIRVNCAYRLNQKLTSLSFVPIMSLRRKNGYKGTSARIQNFDIIGAGEMVVQIRTMGTLTGAQYQTPNDTDADNTALEYDESATSIEGGIPIWTGLIAGDARASINNISFAYDLISREAITICARLIKSVSGGAEFSTVVRWSEEW